jgi:Flp pilus assembly protein TadD/SAM-dependent methyltransferase
MPIAITPEERTRAYKQSFVSVQRQLDAGHFADAVSSLERIASAGPDCPEMHNDLAVLYHAAGRLIDADRESRRALEMDPFHPDIRENHNAIVAALTATGAARAVAPIAVAPTPAPAPQPTYRDVLRAAETLLASGKLDAAVAELERFVDREPATAEAWNDLGVLHRDGGRLRAARAALVVAMTIEPNNRQAAFNLVRVMLELGQPADALRTLEPFLTRDPRDVEGLTLAGDISVALKQPSDASSFYRSALAIDPSSAEIAVKLATAAATLGVAPLAAGSPPPARVATATFLAPPLPAPIPFASAPSPSPSPFSSSAPYVVAETVRALEYDPRVRLVTPDETYDTVTCRTPIDRLPNPIAALTEMTRLLKPGGKLWIELGGPLEVIKHGSTKGATASAPIEVAPAAWRSQ